MHLSITLARDGWRQSASGLWYHPTVCRGLSAHVESVCEQCGAQFFERKHKASGPKGGRGRHFCSRFCASSATVREQDVSHLRPFEFPKGQVPHNYIGRVRHSAGYVVVTGQGERHLEHRAVMAAHLKRELRPSEIVHHLNGDKTDNRPDNLEVMSQSDHTRLHWAEGAFAHRRQHRRVSNG